MTAGAAEDRAAGGASPLPRRRLFTALPGLCLGAALPTGWAAAPGGTEVPRVKWRALLRPGWQPAAYFSRLPAPAGAELRDDDPRARERLQQIIELGRDAPPAPQMAGREVRLAGFALPLAQHGEDLSRFLLTPYQGACVHTPPPPANQAVVVDAAPPLPAALAPYPVWVHGRLELQPQRTPYMHAAWHMRALGFEPFDETADRAFLPRYSVF
jgi:uncharacterized protein